MGYRYKITYFDPSDPEGRRIKTWYFRTLAGARHKQADLRVAWKDPAWHFPIRKVKRRRRW